MAESETYVGIDVEGMDDLGNLPRTTIALRTRSNGLITRQSEYLYEGGPGLEGWEQVIRHAVAHSKDYDFLETLDGEVSPTLSTKRITHPDGSEISLASLAKMHPKTREKFAKELGLGQDAKGKTPKQLDEMIFATVNTMEGEA